MKQAVAVLVLFAAVACSGSHGSSTPQAAAVPAASLTQPDSFGSKVCTDHCGCLPPKAFQVLSFTDIHENDLCGLPWSCEYRCSSDCASCCKTADLNHDGKVDIYDLNLAGHIGREAAEAVGCCIGKC